MSAPDALDYSWARPDPAQMAAAGIKLVCRYLTGDGKAVTRAEIDALHAAGVGVLLNYEANAGDAKGGASAGRQSRAAAVAAADALGAPDGLPIYYSVDFDASGQLGTVRDYLTACDDPHHKSRAYGQAQVLDTFGRPGWQTVGWSGGQVSTHAVLYQYEINADFHGSAVDHNRIIHADQLGAWWPPGKDPADMPLTPQDAEAVAAAVWRYSYQDRQALAYLVAAADPARIARAVVAALPKTGAGITEADVEAAVRAVFADAGKP